MGGDARAVLVVERGVDGRTVIPLERTDYVFGKSPTANVVLNNPYVSRRHARIVQRQQRFEIEDLGSKNGTLVNGRHVPAGSRRRLESGDRIELGPGQVVLRFEQDEVTATLTSQGERITGELMVDARTREVWVRGNKIRRLSRKEFDILHLLYQRRGEAVSRDDIATHGWPERLGEDVGLQDIEQYIRRIRQKLERDRVRQRRVIVNVRGFGYMIPASDPSTPQRR